MKPSRNNAINVVAAAAILYFASWIYELANLGVLYCFSGDASLVLAGPIPVGVTAVSDGAQSFPLAKPLQILISSAAMFALYGGVRTLRIPAAQTVALTMLSIFLASGYWEMLSLVGWFPYPVHVAIFTGLALGAKMGLSRIFSS